MLLRGMRTKKDEQQVGIRQHHPEVLVSTIQSLGVTLRKPGYWVTSSTNQIGTSSAWEASE